MKNVLFVCTGNSARSIIAEAIVNNHFKDKYKAYSAGSNPTGKINNDIKKFLEMKNYDLSKITSKNFDTFINNEIKMDHVITVCNNANKEVCPIWPKRDQIIQQLSLKIKIQLLMIMNFLMLLFHIERIRTVNGSLN